MTEVIPAILEGSFKEFAHKLHEIRGGAGTVQIDVCDGVLVSSVTWPYLSPVSPETALNYEENFQELQRYEADMPFWEEFNFELDLMVSNPEWLLPDLMIMGPSKIILHAASFENIFAEVSEIKTMVPSIVEVAIAITPDADPEILFPLIDDGVVSSVQCMGIARIGHQGEPFDERVLSHLRTLREKYPELPLSVDGGVNMDTAVKLKEAGATHLVVGSAIWESDTPKNRIKDFQDLVY